MGHHNNKHAPYDSHIIESGRQLKHVGNTFERNEIQYEKKQIVHDQVSEC